MDLEEIKRAADMGSPEAHEKLGDYYLFEYPPNRQLATQHSVEVAGQGFLRGDLYSEGVRSASPRARTPVMTGNKRRARVLRKQDP